MEKISFRIKASQKEVEIFLGFNILNTLKEMIKKTGVNDCFVLSNKTVWRLWGERIEASLKGIRKTVFLIPDGERFKNITTVSKIYDGMSTAGCTRKTAFIAVGGGVVGDLGGFVASTYHRGIPLIHVPTTLLAQVDSSLGGKTGYNLKSGKNLVGTFYQPVAVIADSAFLSTLPEREYLSGMAEVIKSAVIKNKRLFLFLEKNRDNILKRDNLALTHIIKEAERVKISVVKKDEKESGERAILNFGHTLGHAIEKYLNWKILHGEAVAIGMCYAAFLSFKWGFLSGTEYERIVKMIKDYGLPDRTDIPVASLLELIRFDKKRKDREVEWVLLKGIGKALWGQKIKVDKNEEF